MVDNTDKTDYPAIQSIIAIDKVRRIYLPTSLLGKTIVFQYDSGSDVTTIGKDTWIRLGSPTLSASKFIEHAEGNTLKTIGSFKCKIRAADQEDDVIIDVISRNNLNLFGLNAIDELDLWNMPLDQVPQTVFRQKHAMCNDQIQ